MFKVNIKDTRETLYSWLYLLRLSVCLYFGACCSCDTYLTEFSIQKKQLERR